ncbi:MAG TPA: (d)CMP kinase [Victivallales bacterium]|nr:(d)CMP kinase [Victivallales bacterium]
MKNLVIAIDGPAASGKSTAAKLVSAKLGAYYINTGNMYRAAAISAIKNHIDLNNVSEEELLQFTQNLSVSYILSDDNNMILTINDEPADPKEIRSNEASNGASKIAESRVIRDWLVEEQRKFAKFGLIVMEGRDIGTNVFPNAKYKFYLTASPEVRALRRLKQDDENPPDSTVATVANEIAERDRRDSQRKVAPLKQAKDAVLIDSSNMNIKEVINTIVKIING